MLRKLISMGAVTVGVALGALPVSAQEFPKKQPIKIVVGVPAGGATDALARITADFLSRRIDQSVVVENKPGASGTIGADYVARSQPDGYTIFITGTEFAAVPAVRKTPYKYDEMTYLVRGFVVSPLMYGSPKFPVANLSELVTYMKANPGKVRYGSTGTGAIVHMGVSMFEGAAGVKGLHVPYVGIAPVFNDLLAGHIDISQGAPPFPEGLRVLGSIGSKRNKAYPNLPTIGEVGFPAASWDQWFGFLAPPNTPKPITDRLISELNAVFKDPQAIAKYRSTVSFEPDPDALVGEQFRKQVVEENKTWKLVVEREKIKVD